ncbi:TraB/GumN family protein [Thioalkalivibrio thiocyanodenitrificans]|uniref:TraB/GumN family protein n=1 Tax=Thioalkalivibrio thiocyanodenitrificans TaxID=243063 RepID=UPI000366AD97|nr:TraB/GumN family protein [Thioalkalivibrio thiocyanodenitrificans]
MRMKWVFRLIAGLFLSAWMAGTAQAQLPGPALWEVRDGDAGLVIMGSVHMLRPDTRWLRPEIGQRFDETAMLVLEIADLQGAEAVTTPIVLRKGFYPPGQSLADELSPDTFERAVSLAEDLGAGGGGFVRMRPWLAGMVLTQLWAASHGYDPGAGVDRYFSRRAAAAGKPVIGLETVEEQMDLLIEGLGDDGETMMKQTLGQLEDPGYMDALVGGWLKGDMEALEQLMREAFAGFPESHEVLIAARNRRWAEAIGDLLATPGSAFVVVGAAHLVGPDNVLDLLEARGYTVTRQ